MSRSLKDKYLGTIPLKEDDYKVDFNISDKYQSFSAELLRLALLGLAVFGFLITNVIMKLDKTNAQAFYKAFSDNKWTFLVALITLVISAACAMAHRYFATDTLTHFIRKVRLIRMVSELKKEPEEERDNKALEKYTRLIENEKDSFDDDLSRSGRLLLASVGFLLTGICCILAGVAQTMMQFIPQIQ